jgi:predicted ABC-type ATPase
VFSHPSKLELIDAARAADYTIVLHVLLIPEALAVERVRHRVSAGGHDVPENKIRESYQRLWGSSPPQSPDAIPRPCTTTAGFKAPASSLR